MLNLSEFSKLYYVKESEDTYYSMAFNLIDGMKNGNCMPYIGKTF